MNSSETNYVEKDENSISNNLLEEKANEDENLISLQLDDVIKIQDPENEELNNNEFLIDYIDKNKIRLINTETLNIVLLGISPDKILGDGTITTITIINRNENKGYARQNGLLPGIWINIYFGGDAPMIISGEITNIEEDMIEIRCYPDNEIIYINFDYKGLPEDIAIERIEIRNKPEETGTLREDGKMAEYEETEESNKLEEEEIKENRPSSQKITAEEQEFIRNVPSENVKEHLRQFILRADQIQFGSEELGPIVQYVDSEKSQQRFSIEMQTNDLLDEILSTIPNSQRSSSVLNNIHIMIERFKQLRQKFSTFDENGNITGSFLKESSYKPLVNELMKFKTILYWLLPVVKNTKKIYNVTTNTDENDYPDVIAGNTTTTMEEVKHLIENYQSNDSPDEQNKYVTLMKDLNSYFTPFEELSQENLNDIIYEKEVENNLHTILDNLDDFYSSVAENDIIKMNRFVVQKYNLGSTKLNALQISGSKMITEKLALTHSDQISLKSIIMLPEPIIRFSRINLPGTNLLERSNLNRDFINYWQLFKKNVNVNTIYVENIENEIDFDPETFANKINNYSLMLNGKVDTANLTKVEIYKKFLTSIIPKIKVLFNLVKKYIHGKLSINNIINYLEPFLVYADDLTYQQYNTIKYFLDEKISLFNKTFVDRNRNFSSIKNIKPTTATNQFSNIIYNIFPANNHEISEKVFDCYDYRNTDKNYKLTNSELLQKIISKDSGKLYNSAIAFTGMPLMFPDNLSSIFDFDKEKVENEKQKLEKGKCINYVVAKQYHSIDDLLLDNDKEIYFDKKYDKTNYAILEQYERDMIKMDPEDFLSFLVKKLETSLKISSLDAEYLADALISGVKSVKDGNYAILFDLKSGGLDDGFQYYKRTNNQWVLDNTIDKNSFISDNSLLCNMQSECIDVQKNIENECESTAINEKTLVKNSIQQIMDSFDKKYYLSKQELETQIKVKIDYSLEKFEKLNEIEFSKKFFYNNLHFSLGTKNNEDHDTAIFSPFQKLLDTILGQSDFIKEQADIIRFCTAFTREFIANTDESEHWRYCIKTGVELIPTFRFVLASAFQVGYDPYKATLENLKQTNGKLSDDGDAWIDKFTGREMCKIDFDFEEGYEDGFKKSSRAIMEQDAGDALISAEKKALKTETLEVRMMNNIISHIASSMGVNMEDQREYIIQHVASALLITLPTEGQHKTEMQKMIKQGKTPPSYKDIYNSVILYTTLGMFLIAAQTSIPSLKTRKTFPGCVRSFTGFPIEGVGDDSSLMYLACIVYKTRNQSDPWNVTMKRKETFIADKIKDVIQKVLLDMPGVIRKFQEKTEYLLLKTNEEIAKEHTISTWNQFLPPLNHFKITGLLNITPGFEAKLRDELKTGASSQRESILIVESKVIFFSLAIQEKIQHIVGKKKLLLANSANQPFVENSCCNENASLTAIDYFIKEDEEISEYNKKVFRLSDLLLDIKSISKAPLFFSKENTKNIYTLVSNQEFNEQTIYRAFIVFCKFSSLIPISEDLVSLCTSKPEYISNKDSTEEIIAKLKRDGRNYTNESFIRLLQIVNRKNIMNVNVTSSSTTMIQNIGKLIENFDEKDEELVYPSLRKLINGTLDTFDIAVKKDTEEMRALKNHLARTNEEMKIHITDFIKKNNSLTGRKQKYIDTLLKEIFTWKNKESTEERSKGISDDDTYNFINFVKSYIHKFTKIFPNIILNNVDYDKTQIQLYWGLSSNHEKDIKKIIKDYYLKLRPFYSEKIVSGILSTIQLKAEGLLTFVNQTPYYTSIKYKEKQRHSIFDKVTCDLLFEQYFLLLFTEYINLTDNESMLFYENDMAILSVDEVFTIEDLEEKEQKLEVVNVVFEKEVELQGNKKELKTKTANLLLTYLNIMNEHKKIIDRSYSEIMDKVFKISEREKDTFTDRLQAMTDEERDADTILKINKLGVWSKGLQKGLTKYTKETYDDERDVMEKITEIERTLQKNRNGAKENMEQSLEDYLEELDSETNIEADAYDMSNMTEDYDDGNFESDEVDDYSDHY